MKIIVPVCVYAEISPRYRSLILALRQRRSTVGGGYIDTEAVDNGRSEQKKSSVLPVTLGDLDNAVQQVLLRRPEETMLIVTPDPLFAVMPTLNLIAESILAKCPETTRPQVISTVLPPRSTARLLQQALVWVEQYKLSASQVALALDRLSQDSETIMACYGGFPDEDKHILTSGERLWRWFVNRPVYFHLDSGRWTPRSRQAVVKHMGRRLQRDSRSRMRIEHIRASAIARDFLSTLGVRGSSSVREQLSVGEVSCRIAQFPARYAFCCSVPTDEAVKDACKWALQWQA